MTATPERVQADWSAVRPLSDGWWRGQHGVIREVDAYGPSTAFLAELHVTLVLRLTLGAPSSSMTQGTYEPHPKPDGNTELLKPGLHQRR